MKRVLEKFEASVFGDEATYTYVPDSDDLAEKADQADLDAVQRSLTKAVQTAEISAKKRIEDGIRKIEGTLTSRLSGKADRSEIDEVRTILNKQKKVLGDYAVSLSTGLKTQAEIASAEISRQLSAIRNTDWKETLAPAMREVTEQMQRIEHEFKQLGSVSGKVASLETRLQSKFTAFEELDRTVRAVFQTLEEERQELNALQSDIQKLRDELSELSRWNQTMMEQRKEIRALAEAVKKEKAAMKEEILAELANRPGFFSRLFS